MITYDKRRIRKTIHYIIIFLGVYQLLGGLYGLTLVFTSSPFYVLKNLLYFVIIISLFIYSTFCGIKLIRGKQLSKGIKHSLINQYLQLIQFEILGNGLYYVAGCYLALGFSDTPKLHLITHFSIFNSSCFISFLANSNEITLSLNIVSFVIVIFLNYVTNHVSFIRSEMR